MRANVMREAYVGDLARFLRHVGCSTVEDFLRQFPGKPYVDIAAEYTDLTGAGLVRAQMEEARTRGTLRKAAMDVLVRELNGHLPGGWGQGDRVQFHTGGAYAWWVNALTVAARSPELEPAAQRIWQALIRAAPPIGWRPSSVDDPLIQSAFGEGWPER